ncbi:MAG: galactose mutarotase [Saprospiraceae bacterium]|nr:galactose mutarotase [Saprospiraceae bacterium]
MINCLSIFSGCKNDPKSLRNMPSKNTIKVEKSVFGLLPDQSRADIYTLTNTNGMRVKITNYGGIITSWTAPDRWGVYEDIVLGYDKLEHYVANNPYFGAIIGRYGNRIAKGKFSLDGKNFTLAVNNIGNHLHGGIIGFDKVLWRAEIVEGEEATLMLTYLSKDGEEGYPGNLNVTVIFTLTNANELKIDYEAETDQTTVVNLTSHSYFNLTAHKTDILGHTLKLNADKFLPVDKTLIPTGELRPVICTPFDFINPKIIGQDIRSEDEQLFLGGGYDHCWVLNTSTDALTLAATLSEPNSGRVLDVFTTEPAIQFYSGNFLDGTITGKNNVVYGHRSGLCLETQHFPDSPNQKTFPNVVLKPGEKYKSTTLHRCRVMEILEE